MPLCSRIPLALSVALMATTAAVPSDAQTAYVPRAVVPVEDAPESLTDLVRERDGGETVVDVPGAQWLQLRLQPLRLGDATLTVTGADGETQTFDQAQATAWGGLTAVFNGETLTVSRSDGRPVGIEDVVVGLPAGTSANEAAPGRGLLGGRLDRFVVPAPSDDGSGGVQLERAETDSDVIESICDGSDDRTASRHPFVARIMPIGCTGWLIPGGTMLTAAHCTGPDMQTVEFNVPSSRADGSTVAPPVRDQYRVIATSVRQGARQIAGDDWAVFRVAPNTQTGRSPAAIQGGTFTLSTTVRPTDVTITGHGVDGPAPGFGRMPDARNADNQTQQTHSGRLTQNDVQSPTQATLRYAADTQGGNSGGPVIAVGRTDVAVGIHTFGSRCPVSTNSNGGTSFRNAALWDAVADAQPVGPTITAPGMGWEGAGAGLAIGDLDGDARPDMVAAVYDDPARGNTFRYRIGRDLGRDGVASAWSDFIQVPGVGWEGQGAGVVLRDLDGDARPEMILMAYDNPRGANTFRYRVGADVGPDGVAASWSPSVEVPGLGWEGAGADVAFADLDGDARPEMILMAYDDPRGANTFRYRVGQDVNADGIAASWGPMVTVPGVGHEGAGAGMTVGQYGGDARPDLLLLAYDDPARGNTFRYRIGLDLDATGTAASWESGFVTVPGVGWEGQGAGVATVDLDGDGVLDLVTMAYDNPARSNTIRYRVVSSFR